MSDEEKRTAFQVWWLDRAKRFPAHRITLAAVKKVIRRANPGPEQKEPCFVCGQHRRITHSHHLVDIGRVAKVLHHEAVFDWAPKIPVVSLCPNHHTYWHEMNRLGKEYLGKYIKELDEEDEGCLDNLVRLAELRDDAQSRVWAEVRRALPARE